MRDENISHDYNRTAEERKNLNDAAPDMYGALMTVRLWAGNYPPVVLELINKAIDKANGEMTRYLDPIDPGSRGSAASED
jgi:hypothetical protein